MTDGIRDDRRLIQIVDAAMAEAVRKAGAWVVCRPGCYECCMGPFPISAADAERLREGLASLEAHDPARARQVRDRARDAVNRLARDYPGDPLAADEESCPALDPATGTCDLYAARPITCRTFGPAVRFGDGPLGVCELCFQGATDEQIAECHVGLDDDAFCAPGETIVAYALGAGAESVEGSVSRRS